MICGFISAVFLAGCSLGYDSEGPYPYSKANQPPSTTYQSSGANTQTASNTQTPDIRNKPVSPRASATNSASSITVGPGDTVYAISRRYGVSVRAVINSNKLRPPYLLNRGQKLNIPAGISYVVKRGDTVYGISRARGTTMNDLVRVNSLKAPYALNVGQTLKLPGASSASNRQVALGPPPKISGKGFMWPVTGSVISGYGPKQAGYHNDGVNIRAPMGSSVVAAESGVVVHASNKLKGYGNLILIKHQNGWVTAYAHNDKILVKKGDQVSRGQTVAQVGSTGRVDSPQLHFEMRKGSRAVNPTLYLKS
ncbi:MAG: peptidoglycan DD-metalloendopeptidase family protein [Kordiimonadaceae bacterium]|nr:peptidoglycan DD-metalloendopeptidase family protein [Kordiimonadaceae bacterium]MBT6036237.1 peptidoglycan DD-metalloendopeptidase family protein [Kordiimonadaceae bacterium]